MTQNARNSPAFENIDLQPPQLFSEDLIPGEENQYLRDIGEYLKSASRYFLSINQWSQELDLAVRSGWLVNDARVISISANKVIADTVFTQDLFVGGEEKIEIKGSTNTIEVYDDQGTPELRTKIGKLGAGSDNYGIDCYDSSGSLIFSVGDTTFIDGAIITDATLTNAKLVNSTIQGGKISNATVDTVNMADESIDEDKRINVYNQSATYAFGTVNAGTAKGVQNTFSHSLGVIPTVVISINNATFNNTDTVVSFVVGNISTTQIRVDGYFFNNSGVNLSVGNYTVDIDYW